MGFILNLKINAKNLPFIGFWNPSCVRRSVPAHAYIKPTYAGFGLHTQVKGFLGLLLSKKDLFAYKNLYFPF